MSRGEQSVDRRRIERRKNWLQPAVDEQHMIPDKAHRNSLGAWVDSAALRLLQQIVTVVLLPAAVWGLNLVVERLAKIDERLARGELTAATAELRVQHIEKTNEAQNTVLTSHDARLRNLESEVRASGAVQQQPGQRQAYK